MSSNSTKEHALNLLWGMIDILIKYVQLGCLMKDIRVTEPDQEISGTGRHVVYTSPEYGEFPLPPHDIDC